MFFYFRPVAVTVAGTACTSGIVLPSMAMVSQTHAMVHVVVHGGVTEAVAIALGMAAAVAVGLVGTRGAQKPGKPNSTPDSAFGHGD